jgi:hypothetical protein
MTKINEKQIEDIAKVCHEANRAYCASLGDASQLPWDQAPEWQKTSAIDGVKYHLLNPDSKPSDSHENWSRVKVEDGWKHGETKDPEAKTHPCLVPFEQLPREQQLKDHLFLGIVRSLAW